MHHLKGNKGMRFYKDFSEMDELEIHEHNQDWMWSDMHFHHKLEKWFQIPRVLLMACELDDIACDGFGVYCEQAQRIEFADEVVFKFIKPILWKMGVDGDESAIAIDIETGQNYVKQLEKAVYKPEPNLNYLRQF